MTMAAAGTEPHSIYCIIYPLIRSHIVFSVLKEPWRFLVLEDGFNRF